MDITSDSLVISSSLNHDGDQFVRFGFRVQNARFSGTTLTWGYADEVVSLADALIGFPKTGTDSVRFQFGSSRTGTCLLEFLRIDRTGHTAVWVTLEGLESCGPSGRFEQVSLFLKVEPAAIDRFAAALRGFRPGMDNEATLPGIE